jgi:diguanylate cyclase (GGDEF)-like protein
LLLDVDYFKRYNDNYGHPKGDEVLKTLGSLLRQTVSRTSDLVARYGGEEFCAVLPNTGVDNAVRIAEKILQAIQQAQIPHEYSSIAKHVTVSIGVYASVPSVRDTSAHFYQQADIALYQAKGAGRNQIRVMADN